MRIITIMHEGSTLAAHSAGQLLMGGAMGLREIKGRLLNGMGRIVYLRPSHPGHHSPVTLYDSRPQSGYRGGLWAR